MRAAIAALLVLLSSCSDKASPPVPDDATRPRRVFEKPAGGVRAVPPHAIRGDGVGPFVLGSRLRSVLQLTGPRVVLMELEGVVDYSLARAEGDTIVIGAPRGQKVSFITILDSEIAKTEKGASVGSTAAELGAALGAPLRRPDKLFDPRLRVFAALPNVRFAVDGDRVTAVTVGADDRPPAVEPKPRPPGAAVSPAPPRCDVAALVADEGAVIETARLGGDDDAEATVGYGCIDGETPLAIVTSGERVVGVSGPPGKLRRLRVDSVSGLRFAGAIDLGGDGSDEVIVVSREATPDERSWRVEVYRHDNGRFSRVGVREVYRVAAASAPWIGAALDEIDLLLELEAGAETLEIGGLLLHRRRGQLRNAAPLLHKKLVVRSRVGQTSVEEAVDAGVGADARSRRPRDAGVGKRGAP